MPWLQPGRGNHAEIPLFFISLKKIYVGTKIKARCEYGNIHHLHQ